MRWVSFDLKSGRRGPDVRTRRLGTVKRIIGEGTDVTLEAYCWDAEAEQPVPGWDAATLPGATVLAVVDDDEALLWAGMVLKRRSTLAATSVTLSVVSLERYFNRRYVGDHSIVDRDLAHLFAVFAGDALVDGPPIVVDAPDTGVILGRETAATDDLRVLAVLEECGPVGLEFTVDPEWANPERTAIRFRLRARKRLGSDTSMPSVTYALPGNILDGEFIESYDEEHGANDVLAASAGEGETRPESTRKAAVLPTWCRFERRITPAVSIIDTVSLDQSAADELAQTWDGLKQLNVTARLEAAAIPNLGDNVAISVTSPRFPARVAADGSMTDGLSVLIRSLGWEIDLDARTVTPILVDRQEIP